MTISDMQTTTEAPRATLPAYHPLAGWDSAARFHAATYDWMARAFQQWLTLVTSLPAQFMFPLVEPHGEAAPATPVAPLVPAQPAATVQRAARAPASRQRSGEGAERAVAKGEPKRGSRSQAKAKSKARAAGKPRSRA